MNKLLGIAALGIGGYLLWKEVNKYQSWKKSAFSGRACFCRRKFINCVSISGTDCLEKYYECYQNCPYHND